MDFEIITFGCRLNIFESEQIRVAASEANLRDAVVINSCAVTSEAERQLRQTIRRVHKQNPEKKIIITGCAAQINPQKYTEFPGVVKVLGNLEKTKAKFYRAFSNGDGSDGNAAVVPIITTDIMSVTAIDASPIHGFDGKVRGYIQVQNGCNHRCTFCTIPFGRGNSRSMPIGEIVRQAQILVEQGYKELVLTGVDMTDYGLDLPAQPKLGEMVLRLLKNVPQLMRLRLSSIDVAEVDDLLLDLIMHEKRLMPHIHLSLQAGDDMVLKRMKRRHNRTQVIEFCNKVRAARPEVVFGADIIAGFPTETDIMFQNTYNIIEEAGIIYLHVFPYSERDGTPAAKMPPVPKAVRKERARLLREQGAKLHQQHLYVQVGKKISAIIEQHGIARGEDYSQLHFSADGFAGHAIGDVIELTPYAVHDNVLLA